MERRSRGRLSGAFLGIAALGFLGPACGLVVGSETIETEPLGEGGKAGSGGAGGIGGVGGGAGGVGGTGGAGGGTCEPVPAACSSCLSCGEAEVVKFTKAETKYFPVTMTEGSGTLVPDQLFGCSKAAGPEHVYAVTYSAAADVNPQAFLTASLKRSSTTFDTVLYAKKECCVGPTEACADSSDGVAGILSGGEVISMPIQSGETFYIVVDGADAADQGSFEIVLNVAYGWSCEDPGSPIPIPLELGGAMTLKGSTDISNETNGCGSAGFGWLGWGSSTIYSLSWAQNVTAVDIKLKNTDTMVANDTLFYLRTQCETQGMAESKPASELACIDVNDATNEMITLPLTGKSPPLFLFADVGKGEGGPFELTLTPK